ncbi:ORF2 [Agrotis segetum granulovirus]|uniref:ORF2 n=1 Tax=Agrotis segetum granulosis virus TaxID=10464 RepID=Q6QXC1_GVAS|nr:P78/83 [Agrotis segetum granulovirus]AAS82736.1 ORF2 [Agrotis segetum granulovirus]AKN63277.1 P78/83 [Agrotis segetum granulovirus]
MDLLGFIRSKNFEASAKEVINRFKWNSSLKRKLEHTSNDGNIVLTVNELEELLSTLLQFIETPNMQTVPSPLPQTTTTTTAPPPPVVVSRPSPLIGQTVNFNCNGEEERITNTRRPSDTFSSRASTYSTFVDDTSSILMPPPPPPPPHQTLPTYGVPTVVEEKTDKESNVVENPSFYSSSFDSDSSVEDVPLSSKLRQALEERERQKQLVKVTDAVTTDTEA